MCSPVQGGMYYNIYHNYGIDAGVERFSQRIDEYYGDNRTAFILTADHGMSEWGLLLDNVATQMYFMKICISLSMI